MGQIYKYFFILALLFSAPVLLLAYQGKAVNPGLKVFIAKRCYTCHTIKAIAKDVEREKIAFAKEKGVDIVSDNKERIGVDLSDVGTRRDVASFTKFLKNPKIAFKPTPQCKRKAKKKYRKRFRGTPEDFKALVTFLSGLKYESHRKKDFVSCLKGR